MRKVLIILMLIVFVNVCFAQRNKQRNDFIGTWVLNTTETKIPGFDIKPKDSVTEISYADSVLRIVLKEKKDGEYIQTSERIYYTDGRGETNGKESTITKWKGSKLVSKPAKKKKQKANKPKKKLKRGEKLIGTAKIDSKVIITWKLSDDGKKLTELHTSKTRTTSSGFVFGGETKTKTSKSELFRIVYDKQ